NCWDAIAEGIIQVTNKNIPFKKISNTITNISSLTTPKQEEANDTIKDVNERQETSILLIKDVTDTETINNIKD
ncbi:423_t:CDS:2, partial [Dentiscutata heterogama]